MINEEMTEWIKLGRQNESVPAETNRMWRKWTCRPVEKYPLAPRQARAILEMAGHLASRGINPVDVMAVGYYGRIQSD